MTSERRLEWMDRVAHGLVRHAARRAPGPLAERLEEEWLADLTARREGWSRLRLALGCCWAGYVITRDSGLAAVPASRAQVAHANIGGYFRDDSLRFSRSTLTFLLVISLHVAILGALALGLSSKITKQTPARFTATVIEKSPPPMEPPVLPVPQMQPPTVWLPPENKELLFEKEVPPLVDANDTAVDFRHGEPPPTAPSPVERVQGGPGSGFPSASDFYPPHSIRAGEQGIATVQVCIDGRGRLTEDPTILQSSGIARLDEGALKLARAGSGHYRATTEDGRPVASCYPFRIRFDLKK